MLPNTGQLIDMNPDLQCQPPPLLPQVSLRLHYEAPARLQHSSGMSVLFSQTPPCDVLFTGAPSVSSNSISINQLQPPALGFCSHLQASYQHPQNPFRVSFVVMLLPSLQCMYVQRLCYFKLLWLIARKMLTHPWTKVIQQPGFGKAFHVLLRVTIAQAVTVSLSF